MAHRIDKQLQECRMRCKMSIYTLLKTPLSIAGHKAGKSESLNTGFIALDQPAIRQARNKVRNNHITRGYYAATMPLRLAS